jgi:hypothetical protein
MPVKTGAGLRSFGVIERTEAFPGFLGMRPFVKELALHHRFKSVVDIGGGANPKLDEPFVREHNIDYYLLDISKSELDKASSFYNKICVDICAPVEVFHSAIGDRRFDFFCSHMLLEHIKAPHLAHCNIFAALLPGGLSLHLYPSPNNIPLFINKITPEWLSSWMLNMVQPHRANVGKFGKFPAYYRLGGKSAQFIRSYFGKIGYEVVCHTGFVGHDYYRRIPVLREIERMMRGPLTSAGIRWTSFELLLLRKPALPLPLGQVR